MRAVCRVRCENFKNVCTHASFDTKTWEIGPINAENNYWRYHPHALTMPCFPPFSYNKKDSEASTAQARLKDLEAQMNSKEAMLATALSEKRGLEATLADLREQLQEVRHCCGRNMTRLLYLWLLVGSFVVSFLLSWSGLAELDNYFPLI